MENKYYIDENGLIALVQGISNSIIQHTSGEIVFNEDPDTGEKTLEKPNNFPTVQAVTDYLKNRKKLTLVQESFDDIIPPKVSEYNGEEGVQVDMNLITSEDINKLFR